MSIFKFNKKAILLIHGFAGGIYDYGNLANDLQLYKNFDVFTFTLPGHEKFIINKVTNEDWIKAAETQIEKIINNGYKRIYVIGHSMGGVIAAHLASKYKEVKKLILVAPAFKYFKFKEDKVNILESIKQIPKLFKEYDYETILSRILKVPVLTVKEFIKLVEKHTNDVKNITIPTLILRGLNDDIVPYESIEYIYNNIKSTSVKIVEFNSLTHDMFINKRYDEVKNEIFKFLTETNPKKKTKQTI